MKKFCSQPTITMSQDPSTILSIDENAELPIFQVLRVDVCARAILQYVSIWDLERLISTCRGWQRVVQDYLPIYYSVACIYDAYGRLKLNITHPTPYRVQTQESSTKRVIITDRCPKQNHLSTLATALSKQFIDRVEFHELQLKNIVQFVNLLKSKNITCLNIALKKEYDWYIADYIFSAIHKTKRGLCTYSMKLPRNAHLLVQRVLIMELPELEEIHVHKYEGTVLRNKEENEIELSIGIIESVSRLCNLKRLCISNDACGDDAFLVTLAQRCKKLEYLDMSGCRMDIIGRGRFTARGLAALCRRSPSAVTNLDFSYEKKSFETMIDDFMFNIPLAQELEDFCCIDLMQQHIMARRTSCQQRAVTLKLKSLCNKIEAQNPKHELNIILRRVFYKHLHFSGFVNH